MRQKGLLFGCPTTRSMLGPRDFTILVSSYCLPTLSQLHLTQGLNAPPVSTSAPVPVSRVTTMALDPETVLAVLIVLELNHGQKIISRQPSNLTEIKE